MNNFERFRERNKTRASAVDIENALFLKKGYNTVTLHSLDKTFADSVGSIVLNASDESAYIYTPKNLQLRSGLMVEDSNNTGTWLIIKKIPIVKDVNFNKFLALLCNIKFRLNHIVVFGRFYGTEKTYVSSTIKEQSIIMSQPKPVLVLPIDILSVNDKISIHGQGWLLQSEDRSQSLLLRPSKDISSRNPGVSYFSLAATTMSASIPVDIYVEKKDWGSVFNTEEIQNANSDIIGTKGHDWVNRTITPGQAIVVQTYNGHFQTDYSGVVVLKRSDTSITFKVPFGAPTFVVSTWNKDKEVVYTEFQIQKQEIIMRDLRNIIKAPFEIGTLLTSNPYLIELLVNNQSFIDNTTVSQEILQSENIDYLLNEGYITVYPPTNVDTVPTDRCTYCIILLNDIDVRDADSIDASGSVYFVTDESHILLDNNRNRLLELVNQGYNTLDNAKLSSAITLHITTISQVIIDTHHVGYEMQFKFSDQPNAD